MKKYFAMFGYEIKTLLKSPMTLFMLLYPLIMLFICGYILPITLKSITSLDSNSAMISLLIAFVLVLSMGGFIMGALLGFSLLDNKDENTLINIDASPITIEGYVLFKIIYTYLFAFAANVIMVGGLKLFSSDAYVITYGMMEIRLLDQISVSQLLAFSSVSSLIVPTIALLFVSIAKNKVEGFALMKSGGIIIILPLLALLDFFSDGKQYILSLIPNFWSVKALLNVVLMSEEPSNLSFEFYLLFGALYSIILSLLSMRLFIRRTKKI